MAEASAAPVGNARKSLQFISQRLAKMPLEAIAAAIGKSDSTACRVRDGEQGLTLAEWCNLVDAAEGKLVDQSRVCVDRPIYEALAAISTKAMGNAAMAKQLVWDEQ
jgi:methylphosphotriester-DNA--protein-cysteine methyltransferase